MKLRMLLAGLAALVSLPFSSAEPAAALAAIAPGSAVFIILSGATTTSATAAIQALNDVLIPISVLNPTRGLYAPSWLRAVTARAQVATSKVLQSSTLEQPNSAASLGPGGTLPLPQIPVTKYFSGVTSGPVNLIASSAIQPEADLSAFLVRAANVMATLDLSVPFAQTINVTDYGADPKGETPWTQALLNQACAAIPSTGANLRFPPGRYSLPIAVSCPGKPIQISGDGPGISVLNFTSATPGSAGVVLSETTSAFNLLVRDLSILTTVAQTNGNDGLTINYSPNTGSVRKGPHIDNVELAGSSDMAPYWTHGIHLHNVSGFLINDVNFRGYNFGENIKHFPIGSDSVSAIFIDGDLGEQCSDGSIMNSHFYWAQYGGLVSGDCEGLHWANNTSLQVDWGVTYINGQAFPSYFINDNHFNTYTGGVSTAGYVQGTIHDNLFYKWKTSAQDYTAISLQPTIIRGISYPSGLSDIHDNTVIGYRGTAIGASLFLNTPSDGNRIHHNSVIFTDYVFNLGAVNSTNLIESNFAYGLGTGWYQSYGLSTINRNNDPVDGGTDRPYVTIAAGATSFNGAAYNQDVFYTNNMSTYATISLITNASIGRQITIIAQDSNTTIANNLFIRLKGASNMKMMAGQSLTLKFVGYWQEIGRT